MLICSWQSVTHAEEVYVPYPIIFVHGFRSNEDATWKATKRKLKDYFEDAHGNSKYPGYSDESQYFPSCNYGIYKTGPLFKKRQYPVYSEYRFKNFYRRCNKKFLSPRL